MYDVGGVQEQFCPIRSRSTSLYSITRWEARVFSSLLLSCAMLGISEDAFRWAMDAFPGRVSAGYDQRWSHP